MAYDFDVSFIVAREFLNAPYILFIVNIKMFLDFGDAHQTLIQC